MDVIHPLNDTGSGVNIGKDSVTITSGIEIEDLWRGPAATKMYGRPTKDEVGSRPPAAQGDLARQAVDHALHESWREQQPAIRRKAATGGQNQIRRLFRRVGKAGIGQNGKGRAMDQVKLVIVKQRETATDRDEHSF